MKITVEVDCTPDEARQFFGFPDVKLLQQAAMAPLEKRLAEAANAFSPEALMRSWLSFVPQSPDQMRDILAAMFAPISTRAQGRSDAPTSGETSPPPSEQGRTEPGAPQITQ
jgi:hypothetical protein